MIIVSYDRDSISVSMQGHAQAGPYGHDLVCASASALFYTLAENARQMDAAGVAQNAFINLEAGNSYVRVQPMTGRECVVQLVFDTVMTGFFMLAHQYPESVRVNLMGTRRPDSGSNYEE